MTMVKRQALEEVARNFRIPNPEDLTDEQIWDIIREWLQPIPKGDGITDDTYAITHGAGFHVGEDFYLVIKPGSHTLAHLTNK